MDIAITQAMDIASIYRIIHRSTASIRKGRPTASIRKERPLLYFLSPTARSKRTYRSKRAYRTVWKEGEAETSIYSHALPKDFLHY